MPSEDLALETLIAGLDRPIIGSSRSLRAALLRVTQVASTNAPVLILGETGTGKELFARAVHNLSGRAREPLVRVDCASLSPALSENELFGHVRGAFTGALSRHAGRIALAHQGTLFLDEIGELPLEQQARFLRVLQEGEFEPLGTCQTVRVDVRIIAATHRPLLEEVRIGRFRADLYHRLAAFPIHVPALRERLEDIPALVDHMLRQQGRHLGRVFQPADRALTGRLCDYPWPGNVRELQNAVQRACILTRDTRLSWADFEPLDFGAHTAVFPSADAERPTGGLRTMREVERDHIRAVLEKCGGTVEGRSGAATILGLAPSTLRFRIRKLGLTRHIRAMERRSDSYQPGLRELLREA